MKVLFFIPTLSNGGAERVLCNLVDKLVTHKDINIDVLTLFKDDRDKLPTDVGYRYIWKRKFRGNVQLLKLIHAKWLYNRMIARYGKYDIVVSYLQSPSMRVVGACTSSKTKTVNWIHNEFHDITKLKHLYRNDEECRKSMLHYDATVYMSESAKAAMEKWFSSLAKKKSRVIYNVNDFDKILRLSEETMESISFDSNKFNIISVGRFTQQKAFDRLIRITAFLRKANVEVELYLLGDGALRQSYIDLSEKLGIKNNLHLLGFQENPFKYVRQADLFVCSSIHEGYSTAVTESLVVGTPVVTTDCSGMKELLGVNSEYGIITPNDETALGKAVLTVANDKALYQRLKEKAIERGQQLIQTDNVAPVINLFNDLLK